MFQLRQNGVIFYVGKDTVQCRPLPQNWLLSCENGSPDSVETLHICLKLGTTDRRRCWPGVRQVEVAGERYVVGQRSQGGLTGGLVEIREPWLEGGRR